MIRCDACGAEIPVRTFKAGAIACPSCGGQRDLGDELAARMRAFQQAAPPMAAALDGAAEAGPAGSVAPDGGRGAAVWIAVAAVALAAAAWIILA